MLFIFCAFSRLLFRVRLIQGRESRPDGLEVARLPDLGGVWLHQPRHAGRLVRKIAGLLPVGRHRRETWGHAVGTIGGFFWPALDAGEGGRRSYFSTVITHMCEAGDLATCERQHSPEERGGKRASAEDGMCLAAELSWPEFRESDWTARKCRTFSQRVASSYRALFFFSHWMLHVETGLCRFHGGGTFQRHCETVM